MSEHEFVRENLDAYVAGALPAAELSRVALHVADCAQCRHDLAHAQKMETTMADLFADARPDATLEERMIRQLRKERRPFRWSMWMRFAAGAAAMVMLGVVGAIVQAVAAGGAFPGSDRVGDSRAQSRNNLSRRATTYFGALKGQETESDPLARLNTDFDKLDVVMDASGSMNGEGLNGKEELAGKLSEAKERLDRAQQLNRGKVLTKEDLGDADLAFTQAKRKVQEAGYVQGKAEKSLDGKPPFATYGYGGEGRGRDLTPLSSAYMITPDMLSDPMEKESIEFHPPALGLIVRSGDRTNTSITGGIVGGKAKRLDAATYFKPGDDSATKLALSPAMPPPPPGNGKPTPGGNQGESPDGGGTPNGKLPPMRLPEPSPVATQPKTDPPPVDSGLKIIRTGDMEFEVDSFDKAVAAIKVLLLKTKGAFKLKEDSSKQANGKTRGHVVVRMPPQYLDDFVLDLRRDLGKMGDLKLQQIGSQDVTKQFTDTESELKAARAVEERLLAIIKNGKGDVKDLVAAEKELGVWRTKIEKMEGEIRYYGNQVALSTLTIGLTEKEITAAAALVVNGNVKMRIEVDNVSKARELAEKAVEQFKGRIVKSDEKQYPAGQVEAIVHAEIPPANKDAFRKTLEQLGIVSGHEDTQSQTTEGGVGPVLTPRRRLNDILFQVTLNNIVNIKPKQSVKLDVVTADVRGNFEKLKDEIPRVFKGQVRDAKLDENQDKQKAIAVIDFSVPIEKKADMDKLLAGIGPTLDRVNTQAAITEISTEQKFGYQLTLFSIATVEPREKVRLQIEVKDVEGQSAAIAEMVKAAKGQVARPKSGLNKAGLTEALLVINVPLKESDRLVRDIKQAGKVIDWAQAPNTSVPENDLATTQIAVLLTGPNPIIPSDEGLSSYASKSLYVSFTVFAYCVLTILAGVAFIVPWAVAIYVCVWLVRRMWGKPATSRVAASVAPAAPEAPKP